MITYTVELRQGLSNIVSYVRHPADFLDHLKAEPDITGSLMVIDTLAFLTTVFAVVTGTVAFSVSWSFLYKFLILYAMMFFLISVFVAFDAGFAWVMSRLMGRDPGFWALGAGMAYSRVPLVLGACVYMFLPEKLNALNVLGCTSWAFAPSTLQAVFLERFEFFEVMMVALATAAVHVIAGLGKVKSTVVVLVGWVFGTAVLYYLKTMLV